MSLRVFIFVTALALSSGRITHSQGLPGAQYRAAIDQYCVTCHNDRLKTAGLALDKMEVEVQEVTLQGDRAEAQVRFRTQSGEGEMTLRYQLRREGERWVVELGSVHGGTGAMPPGHPSPGSGSASESPGRVPRSSP